MSDPNDIFLCRVPFAADIDDIEIRDPTLPCGPVPTPNMPTITAMQMPIFTRFAMVGS